MYKTGFLPIKEMPHCTMACKNLEQIFGSNDTDIVETF